MKRYPLADAVERLMVEREQRRLQREEREGSRIMYRQSLPAYIAVCKHGYAVHNLPAMAIWRMHDHVPADAKPAQVLVYRVADGAVDEGEQPKLTPVGYKDGAPVWPKDQPEPALCMLTWTGEIFRQRPRI